MNYLMLFLGFFSFLSLLLFHLVINVYLSVLFGIFWCQNRCNTACIDVSLNSLQIQPWREKYNNQRYIFSISAIDSEIKAKNT